MKTVLDTLFELRTNLEKDCTDPHSWRWLGEQFEAIGLESNAARMFERAEHYATCEA